MRDAVEWCEDIWHAPAGPDIESQTKAHDLIIPNIVRDIRIEVLKEARNRGAQNLDDMIKEIEAEKISEQLSFYSHVL